ncbi:hypothetical protein MRX96_042749 [Rhipicephalus microplus]
MEACDVRQGIAQNMPQLYAIQQIIQPAIWKTCQADGFSEKPIQQALVWPELLPFVLIIIFLFASGSSCAWRAFRFCLERQPLTPPFPARRSSWNAALYAEEVVLQLVEAAGRQPSNAHFPSQPRTKHRLRERVAAPPFASPAAHREGGDRKEANVVLFPLHNERRRSGQGILPERPCPVQGSFVFFSGTPIASVRLGTRGKWQSSECDSVFPGVMFRGE